MNKIKSLLSVLLLAGVMSPVVATPTYEDVEKTREHIELLNVIEELGVTVVINDHLTCTNNEGVAGYWHGAKQKFALCQEIFRYSKNPVWTGDAIVMSDDDLDTIRHEAHHIVQDCMDDRLDGELHPFFNDEDLITFLADYPDWKEDKIIDTYRKDGASNRVIKLEVEAWAVADTVPASSITRVIKQVCN